MALHVDKVLTKRMEVRKLCLAFGLVLAFVYLPKAEALSCYKNTEEGMVAEDCGAQTGCIKKFYQKTQKVVERGCFLTPKEDKYHELCSTHPVIRVIQNSKKTQSKRSKKKK